MKQKTQEMGPERVIPAPEHPPNSHLANTTPAKIKRKTALPREDCPKVAEQANLTDGNNKTKDLEVQQGQACTRPHIKLTFGKQHARDAAA